LGDIRFPYFVAAPPGARELWELCHDDGRRVAVFTSRVEADMQLERIRLWWAASEGQLVLDLEAAIVRALDLWERSKAQPERLSGGDA
jgi:hypothetical protein